MSIRKRRFFSVFFIFDMPRIPQNLRERAIGMFNADMAMNAAAIVTDIWLPSWTE